MANVPNIPSVVVSIEDRSYLQPILSSGRTVLMPFFSKYGEEDFVQWATWDEYVNRFGSANPRKYGMAQIFIKGASQYTQSFLGKRILPSDATYANGLVAITSDESEIPYSYTFSLSGYKDKNGLVAASNNNSLMFYGNGRGSGYNDIVLRFSPLEEYTRFYADENGIPEYQFNFLAATIYERQGNGSLVQIEQNVIPFALVDIDPVTGTTIKDIYDAMSLNIEDRFETISNHVRAALKDEDDNLTQYMGAKDIDPVLFWDKKLNKPAYIIFEDGDVTIEYIDAPQNGTVEYVRFHYTDSNSSDAYAKVEIYNGEILIIDDSAAGSQAGDITYMNIFSSKAFYTLTISDKGNFKTSGVQTFTTTAKEGQTIIITNFDCVGAAVIVDDVVLSNNFDYTESATGIQLSKPLSYGQSVTIISASTDDNPGFVIRPFDFPRYNLWKYLINNEIQLSSGFDGANLYVNGVLNFDGPGAPGAENAKMLLVDFYSTNAELREVLYPKYDFDYVPDFTNDSDVQAAIVGLCDFLQTAFGLHSTGIKYNYKQDLDYRKYNLGISSFINALYPGEANKRHYDSDLGRTIVMPSNYYAMLDHLYADGLLDIAEPVAGISKGAIRSGAIKLTYTPTTLEIEKMRGKQINAIIDEPDGVYFIDQLTMYKKASILSRIHAVKPIIQVKKDIRKLLKDVLQSKDGNTAVNRVQTIIDEYMSDKIYDSQKNKHGWFEYYTSEVIFNENKLEIQVMLTIKPLRSVEKVTVTIGVV